MSLHRGTTLGQYEVVEPLGAGGMGEVYRARDTKLGREIAIKVLPEEFARDRERLARFEREARLLAQLNHANIATLHGLEEQDGQRFLVMELVEGETLAGRIAQGPMPMDEILPLFKQIAEGLEAAHEKGVLHRDLKPANIKITPAGQAKILDFGLAKALAGEAVVQNLSQSPTLTRDATETGVLLGTAPYMSPEQARGKTVDKRADIWAFGCALYETLTAAKPFDGESTTDILAAVVKDEPNWDRLPAETPRSVRRLLRRSLAKDPNRRFRNISDACLELEDLVDEDEPPLASPNASHRSANRVLAGALLVALSTGVAVWGVLRSRPPALKATRRLVVNLPPNQQMVASRYNPPLALSVDGSQLAYIAQEKGGIPRIYLRPLSEFDATPIAGTERAQSVFFSPDGVWIGFIADGKLQKVPVAGGAPVAICCEKRIAFAGASWPTADTLVLTEEPGQVARVFAAGGLASRLTVDDARLGAFLLWPQVLPGGDRLLLTTQTNNGARVASVSLTTGEVRLLELGNAPVGAARYLPTGHLLYAQSDNLWVVPFDLASLTATGAPHSVADHVFTLSSLLVGGNAHFAVSPSGTLAYLPGSSERRSTALEWIDREGTSTTFIEAAEHFLYPRVSPDDRQVAVTLSSEDGTDVWLIDSNRHSRTRLTLEGQNIEPVWTPDGKRIAFSSTRRGTWNLFWKTTDGQGEAELLLDRENIQFPTSWSPDGKILAFYEITSETSHDIYVLPLEGDRVPEPVLVTPASEHSPMFSPDGRWLAYVSNETGREEIYLRSYPEAGRRWTVSTDGGREPIWSADGREIFYRRGEQTLAVSVRTEPTVEIGAPRVLFEGQYALEDGGGLGYSATGAGQRFLMIRPDTSTSPTEIHIVLDWFQELEHLVPTDQ